MASGPITSWHIDGETMETVRYFIFLDSKITADGDYSHEIKRRLLLGRKAMTNLDSILKSRHYFADKDPTSQSYGFPEVMYGCESWTIKKAEHWRTDAFELLEKTLESPSDCKEIQSIIKKISPEYLLKGWCWSWYSNTLATWCKELTHWKRPWCWERLKAGGEGENRDDWMASLTLWTWVWASSGSWWWTGKAGVLQFMGLQWVRHEWATELTPLLTSQVCIFCDKHPWLLHLTFLPECSLLLLGSHQPSGWDPARNPDLMYWLSSQALKQAGLGLKSNYRTF